MTARKMQKQGLSPRARMQVTSSCKPAALFGLECRPDFVSLTQNAKREL